MKRRALVNGGEFSCGTVLTGADGWLENCRSPRRSRHRKTSDRAHRRLAEFQKAVMPATYEAAAAKQTVAKAVRQQRTVPGREPYCSSARVESCRDVTQPDATFQPVNSVQVSGQPGRDQVDSALSALRQGNSRHAIKMAAPNQGESS